MSDAVAAFYGVVPFISTTSFSVAFLAAWRGSAGWRPSVRLCRSNPTRGMLHSRSEYDTDTSPPISATGLTGKWHPFKAFPPESTHCPRVFTL